ncbi:MAG: DUF4159 domain-containing protein [Polyangia bacterium]
MKWLLVMAMIVGTASAAFALGDADRFDVALLQLGQVDTDGPSAVERLGWELEKRTSVVVAPHAVSTTPSDPQLRRHPFLVLHGTGALPPLPEQGLDALRAHLEAGGLLFIDAADGMVDDAFDRDVRTLTRRLFPRASLAPLPAEHVLYKTFYLIGAPLGRVAQDRVVEAVILDGRAVILYSRNDVYGALARDKLGAFSHNIEPGGEPQRELALRVALNIVMYALCLDYKADQVHVPFLLQRRRTGGP